LASTCASETQSKAREKPLTYNIWEARLIRETAAKYPKLATQRPFSGDGEG